MYSVPTATNLFYVSIRKSTIQYRRGNSLLFSGLPTLATVIPKTYDISLCPEIGSAKHSRYHLISQG